MAPPPPAPEPAPAPAPACRRGPPLPPRIEDLGEAEHPTHEPRLGVLDRAVEELVVVEVVVDDIAPRVDGKRRDVVAEVGAAGVGPRLPGDARLQLAGSPGAVVAAIAVLVAVELRCDDGHRQQRVQPVALAERGLDRFGWQRREVAQWRRPERGQPRRRRTRRWIVGQPRALPVSRSGSPGPLRRRSSQTREARVPVVG